MKPVQLMKNLWSFCQLITLVGTSHQLATFSFIGCVSFSESTNWCTHVFYWYHSLWPTLFENTFDYLWQQSLCLAKPQRENIELGEMLEVYFPLLSLASIKFCREGRHRPPCLKRVLFFFCVSSMMQVPLSQYTGAFVSSFYCLICGL